MINVGIIGAGNIAVKMANTIHAEEKAHAYAVASRNIAKAQAFAKEHHFEKAYGSYDALVKDEFVDLVYVAIPHNFHYEHAKLALLNGKHVLCEKAVTLNAPQLEELIALSKERQLVFLEAIWSRFMPLQLQLKKQLDEGIIGKPVILNANLCYPIEHVERMYRADLAGGSLLDLGIYPVHFALQMFGNDYETVSSEMVLTDQGVDRHTMITLKYPDGKMAQLLSSMSTGSYAEATILGDNGLVKINGSNHIDEMTFYSKTMEVIERYQRPADAGGFDFELREAIGLIENGKIESTIVTHEDSLAAMRLLDTVRAQNHFIYPEEDK